MVDDQTRWARFRRLLEDDSGIVVVGGEQCDEPSLWPEAEAAVV